MTSERIKDGARSTGARRRVLLGVLAVAAALGLGLGAVLTITSASAAPAPPAPMITSSPPASTSSTSASFAFTDSQAGVTFECKLDAAAFALCTSPKSYAVLGAGAHTFQVRAVSGGKTSSATSFAWTIDATPPTVTSINRTDPTPSTA
jgi:hypothetical protein